MKIRDLFDLENEITFQKLNPQVNSFNPLKFLRIEHYEIRHPNILARLFNPKENHRLNDYFLRKVLEHLLLMDENLMYSLLKNNHPIQSINHWTSNG